MQTLEQYLKENEANGVVDFAIRVTGVDMGRATFYIRPMGQDGETVDFEVEGNSLAPDRDVTTLE